MTCRACGEPCRAFLLAKEYPEPTLAFCRNRHFWHLFPEGTPGRVVSEEFFAGWGVTEPEVGCYTLGYALPPRLPDSVP